MAAKFTLTTTQQEWFVAHYATAPLGELTAHLNCSYTTVYRLGHELNLDRPKFQSMAATLTEKQLKWLDKHFKHTKNEEMVERLGISLRTLIRIARKRGLSKSPQFMKKCQADTSHAARMSHLAHGTYPPKGFRIPRSEETQFKKGVSSEDRLGKRREAARVAKSAASRKATMKKERARVTFGLPQKTKMRIVRQPREKVYLRFYLKKLGYYLNEEERVAYYDEQTRRSRKVEAKDQRWYVFRPTER